MPFPMPERSLTPPPVTPPPWTPPPWTPPPWSPPPERSVNISVSTFFKSLALILTVIVTTGTIIAVVGKAFYVERPEYNLKIVNDAEEKTAVSETLKQLIDSLAKQQVTMQKLTDDVATIKQDLASMRGTRRRAE